MSGGYQRSSQRRQWIRAYLKDNPGATLNAIVAHVCTMIKSCPPVEDENNLGEAFDTEVCAARIQNDITRMIKKSVLRAEVDSSYKLSRRNLYFLADGVSPLDEVRLTELASSGPHDKTYLTYPFVVGEVAAAFRSETLRTGLVIDLETRPAIERQGGQAMGPGRFMCSSMEYI